MPSLATLTIYPPRDFKEFELMALDYCNAYFGRAELFGRQGQVQYGVDVVQYSEKITAVQCKNYNEKELTEKEIDNIIAKAEEFKPRLDYFVIATTDNNDVKIQKYIYELNDKRSKEKNFLVCVLYWNEIINFLKSYPDLFNKYYGNIFNISGKNEVGMITKMPDLRRSFYELVSKYHVKEFACVDPTINMPGHLPTDIDCFIIELRQELNKALPCQAKKGYIGMLCFINKLEEYSCYLSSILSWNYNEAFTIQSPYIWRKIDSVKKQIMDYKRELSKYYSVATKGGELLTE